MVECHCGSGMEGLRWEIDRAIHLSKAEEVEPHQIAVQAG